MSIRSIPLNKHTVPPEDITAYAPEAVRRRIRKRWEKRREETKTPPILTVYVRPIDVDNEEDPWHDVSRYFSATFRTWWPRPADSHVPGYVPFSLRNLIVRP